MKWRVQLFSILLRCGFLLLLGFNPQQVLSKLKPHTWLLTRGNEVAFNNCPIFFCVCGNSFRDGLFSFFRILDLFSRFNAVRWCHRWCWFLIKLHWSHIYWWKKSLGRHCGNFLWANYQQRYVLIEEGMTNRIRQHSCLRLWQLLSHAPKPHSILHRRGPNALQGWPVSLQFYFYLTPLDCPSSVRPPWVLDSARTFAQIVQLPVSAQSIGEYLHTHSGRPAVVGMKKRCCFAPQWLSIGNDCKMSVSNEAYWLNIHDTKVATYLQAEPIYSTHPDYRWRSKSTTGHSNHLP